jgi:hypothetical protein
MTAEERDAYVQHVWGLDFYERIQTGVEIGKRLRLTNAEREDLKLWPFHPIDGDAKARKREAQTRKRREKGIRPREVYLAEQASRPKPWIAEGISRRTWERRRKKLMTQGVKTIIVRKQGTYLASPSVGRPRKRASKQGVDLRLITKATEDRDMDAHASSSPELASDLATELSPLNVPDISPELQERFSKIRVRFEALSDPRIRAAAA